MIVTPYEKDPLLSFGKKKVFYWAGDTLSPMGQKKYNRVIAPDN